MEPQNIGSFPHTASQSQQPPRTRHSTGFEGQLSACRDPDGSVSRFAAAPSSLSAGTGNHSQRRNTTDSSHNLPARPNSSLQPRPNPNSTFAPSQQARYMTDPPPIDVYGFHSPRPRSTAGVTTTTTPAISPTRKTNVEAVPFASTDKDVKNPSPRCVRCGTDQLSGKAKDGRQEMANNGQNVAASKPVSQGVPQRNPNESVTTKSNNENQPWPPLAPPPSYTNAQRNSLKDIPDSALFGSKVPNDYEQLERRRPNSQHLYRPMTGKDAARPSGTQPQPSNPIPPPPPPSPPLPPPPPVSSAQGATSPLYDSCSDRQPESSPCLFLQKASNEAYLADGDDIIELQPSDSRRTKASTADAAQNNKPNTKEQEKPKLPEIKEIPHTNFAIACMVTFCFNLPFGILAMYFSLRAVKAYQDGNSKLGEKRSRWSIVLSLLGITITTVIISSVVLYIAMQGQKRINRQKTFGTKSSINL